MSDVERLTPEQFDALKATHGECVLVETELGDAVFRGAKRAEFKAHMSKLMNDATKADAPEMLVRQCRVHPDVPTFEAWIDRKPGIALTCYTHVTKLSGLSEAESKK